MELTIFYRQGLLLRKRYESDYYIQDAAFIRLDNVSVGYTFNQKPNATSLK
jgi:iron complex outermembrane receptor protein